MSLPDWIDAAMGPLDEVFALFDQQDSGNVAAGVRSGRHRWFVKWATTDYALEGLIRAAHLHRMVTHPTIVPLEGFLRSAEGTAVSYTHLRAHET